MGAVLGMGSLPRQMFGQRMQAQVPSTQIWQGHLRLFRTPRTLCSKLVGPCLMPSLGTALLGPKVCSSVWPGEGDYQLGDDSTQSQSEQSIRYLKVGAQTLPVNALPPSLCHALTPSPTFAEPEPIRLGPRQLCHSDVWQRGQPCPKLMGLRGVRSHE